MAFGASPAQVVGTMMRDATMPIMLGLCLGLAGAAFATKVIAAFLFQTAERDPVTFALVALAVVTTGGAAAWLPARRAARVDPVATLRDA